MSKDLRGHPDPRWWERCRLARRADPTDICTSCGHVRDLHNWKGCKATSTALIGAPGRCPCAGIAKEYRDAGTLADVVPRSR